MITITCSCGQSVDVNPLAIKKPQACPSCGQLAVCLCAENLPADGGEGDFDAVLVKKGGPKVPGAPNISAYALGGCVNLTLGRLPDNNLSLNSNKVSRKHATLVRVDFGPSRWQIVDNNSSGGVFVNGEKVQQHDLSPGDEIVIGDYKFEYVVAGASGGLGESMLPPQEEYVPAQQAPNYQPQQSGGNIFTNWKIMGPAAAGVVILVGGLIYALSGSGASETTDSARNTSGQNISNRQSNDNAVSQDIFSEKYYEQKLKELPPEELARVQAKYNSTLSGMNLSKIGTYIRLYESRFGAYPKSLGDLARLDESDPKVFVKIGDPGPTLEVVSDPKLLADWINKNTCYVFMGSSMTGGIAAYEKPGLYMEDTVKALIFDGSVQTWTQEDLNTRIVQNNINAVANKKPVIQIVVPPAQSSAENKAPADATNERDKRMKCSSNFRTIGQTIMLDNTDYKGYPPSLGALIQKTHLAASVLICPSAGTTIPAGLTPEQEVKWVDENSNYVYLGATMNIKMDRMTILAYEKPDNHNKEGGHVVYNDGSVKWLTPQSLEQALAMDKQLKQK